MGKLNSNSQLVQPPPGHGAAQPRVVRRTLRPPPGAVAPLGVVQLDAALVGHHEQRVVRVTPVNRVALTPGCQISYMVSDELHRTGCHQLMF